MQLKIDKNKTILSNHAIYKTEKMAFLLAPLADADSILLKIAESIIKSALKTAHYQIKTANEKILLVLDNQKQALIFYDLVYPDAFIKKGDSRLKNLTEFEISEIDKKKSAITGKQPPKLYRIIQTKNYFPILDENQKHIVTTEDKNMIVHGVAGSGKTNICIDKIIYSAGRGYRGRLLYTTYSQGLLNETKLKVLEYTAVLKEFLTANLEFLCTNKGSAIETRLGVYLSLDEDNPLQSLKKIADFLDNQVDYYLIEELYQKMKPFGLSHDNKTVSCHAEQSTRSEVYSLHHYKITNEAYFINNYLPQIKNHNLSARLKQMNHISAEVIYKELYGMILGSEKVLSENEYIDKRSGSFSRTDCQTIHALATDYDRHLKSAGLTDNNLMCRQMLERYTAALGIPKYSLVLIDEVQDMTQINLAFFKSLALKMFCVGDALQMINPSYFSFGHLKRLLYEKDVSFIKELVSNYRSSQKIAELLKALSALNSKSFGVHNFVLFSSSIANTQNTEAVFISTASPVAGDTLSGKKAATQTIGADIPERPNNFLEKLHSSPFNNYTIITPTQKIKDTLKKKFTKQEILTVSESKGLEREIVILYDILSAQKNEWQAFQNKKIDRKTADENSVYRYYFNLLYVAVSRARQKLYVIENAPPTIFNDFFDTHFDSLTSDAAYDKLLDGVDKIEAEQDEITARCREFIKLGQYDNALFWAEQIIASKDKLQEKIRIAAAKLGDYRGGGIRFMKEGMYEDALEYFMLAGEQGLASLAKSCLGAGEGGGEMDAVRYFVDLEGNNEAQEVVLELLKDDLKKLQAAVFGA